MADRVHVERKTLLSNLKLSVFSKTRSWLTGEVGGSDIKDGNRS